MTIALWYFFFPFPTYLSLTFFGGNPRRNLLVEKERAHVCHYIETRIIYNKNMLCFHNNIRQLCLCLTKYWSFKTIIINILRAFRLLDCTKGSQYKNEAEEKQD